MFFLLLIAEHTVYNELSDIHPYTFAHIINLDVIDKAAQRYNV